MNAPAQFDSLTAAQLPDRPLHLAVGMFDGVHLGHRAVVEPAVRAAQAQGGVAAVLSFWPHPSTLFRPDQPTRLIQDSLTKSHVLGRLGISALIIEQFTSEFAQIEAEQFLPRLKRDLPMLAAVYVGDNFRFGHKRRGDLQLLIQSGQALGISVFAASRVSVDGEPVSSTRIRAHLEAGEIEAANALLGYAYFAEGKVTPGKRLGRVIGFPTLNLPWSPDLKPRFGVYAVRVATQGAESPWFSGVANYGLRPTVEDAKEPRLEVHLLADCPFDAGDSLTVEWLHFLRPEMKFGLLSQLRSQIERDREAALEYFRSIATS